MSYNRGMAISDEDIRRVREATDLVALIGERVVLKPRNRDFWGNCPFHNEKTPSFKVDPSTQLYYCFGCGESGDAITFLRKSDNLDFADAVRYLAQRAKIELHETGVVQSGHKAGLYKVMDNTVDFYHQQLMRVKSQETDIARGYLSKRGISDKIARQWQLGYAPGHQSLVKHLNEKGCTRDQMLEANVAIKGKDGRLLDRFYDRIIFPIFDIQGRPIALGGRVIGNAEPKYLNSSETALFSKGASLYALNCAKANITASGKAIVVEGYTDTIAMHDSGFTNTIATLGTALTSEHVKLLSRFARCLIYLFDGDAAGQRAADRAASLVTREITPEGSARPIELMVGVLPAGQDPADLLAVENGAARMGELIANAQPLLRFAIDRRLAGYDLGKPEQRQLAMHESLKVLLPIRGSVLAYDYLNYIASATAASYEVVANSFKNLKVTGTKRVFATRQAVANDSRNDALVDSSASQTDSKTIAGDSYAPKRSKSIEAAIAPERELLLYFIHFPGLREKMRNPLARIVWQDNLHQEIADFMLALTEELSPAELSAQILDGFPGAAALLAAKPEADNQEHAYMMVLVASYTLRIKQTEREISKKRAQLSRVTEASEEYDKLIRESKSLQDELVELRQRFAKLSLVSNG